MDDAPALPRPGYRPMPADFPETFIRVGWDGIAAEMRADHRTCRRWMEVYDVQALLEGKPVLNQLRRQHLVAKYDAKGHGVSGPRPRQSRAYRYVLGLRFRGKRTPTFFDAGLMEEVK